MQIAMVQEILNMLKLLTDLGVESKVQNHKNSQNNGDTLLMKAVRSGNEDAVIESIGMSKDINATNEENLTALHYATKYGYENIVSILLNCGADMNSEAGFETLSLAIIHGNYQIVKHMLEYYNDVNKSYSEEYSLLMLASQNGHLNITSLLIEKKANVNFAVNITNHLHKKFDGMTALMHACEYGHYNIAKLLIEQGANINARSSLNYHYSKFKFGNNNDPNSPQSYEPSINSTTDGNTIIYAHERSSPLALAGYNNHVAIIDLLINKGAIIEEYMLKSISPIRDYVRVAMYKILTGKFHYKENVVNQIKYLCTYTDEGKKIVSEFVKYNVLNHFTTLSETQLQFQIEKALYIGFNEMMRLKLVSKDFFGDLSKQVDNDNDNYDKTAALKLIFEDNEYIKFAPLSISSSKPVNDNNNSHSDESQNTLGDMHLDVMHAD